MLHRKKIVAVLRGASPRAHLLCRKLPPEVVKKYHAHFICLSAMRARWIALTYEGHAHHTIAATWFATLNPHASLIFCRFTQLGLLRLLTTEAVMGDEAMTQPEAWEAYDRWHERSACRTDPRWTVENRPLIDGSYSATTRGRPRPVSSTSFVIRAQIRLQLRPPAARAHI
jgi:hypothetical protein